MPPGYRRKRPPHRPKLEPYTGVIDGILEDDLSAPKKQRHTAKRIFERLRDEHGFDGGYTIVKDIVRILHLAATTMECEVEMALRRLLESRVRFDYGLCASWPLPRLRRYRHLSFRVRWTWACTTGCLREVRDDDRHLRAERGWRADQGAVQAVQATHSGG